MIGGAFDILASVPNLLGGGPTLTLGLAAAGGLWLWRGGGPAPILCLAAVCVMLAAGQRNVAAERDALRQDLASQRAALDFVRAGSAALSRQLSDERALAARRSADLSRIASMEGDCLDVPLPNAYFADPPTAVDPERGDPDQRSSAPDATTNVDTGLGGAGGVGAGGL